jgi:hypothetical protein
VINIAFGKDKEEKKEKGEEPFFRGQITEYEGKTFVSLWGTRAFKKYMEELAK